MSPSASDDLDGLPGEELIRQGLIDLASGKETMAALLVAIGRPRLNLLGIGLDLGDRMPSNPEHRLYDLLTKEHGKAAHSQYNAWIRRLVSFERALEQRMNVQSRLNDPSPCGGATESDTRH